MNKRGFTLIELLAVIVILAIIMVIAVPRILDVIESSRQSSAESSKKLLKEGIKLEVTDAEYNNSGKFTKINNCYTFDFNNKTTDVNYIALGVKNKDKFTGSLTYCPSDNTFTENNLVFNNTTVSESYSYQNVSGTSTTMPSTRYYVRTNLSTGSKEVCGVFPNGTVCLVNDTHERRSEYGTRNENNNFIVIGYSEEKRAEMAAAGASCSVGSNVVNCGNSGVQCGLDKYGVVYCSEGGNLCRLTTEGNIVCE